jgi:hypothetical protein
MEDGIQALQPSESIGTGRLNQLVLLGIARSEVWGRLADWGSGLMPGGSSLAGIQGLRAGFLPQAENVVEPRP